MPVTKIDAVAEKELRSFLISIGEIERVENGDAKCEYCGNIITVKNLHAIIPHDDLINYCCDSAICIAEMTWGGIK